MLAHCTMHLLSSHRSRSGWLGIPNTSLITKKIITLHNNNTLLSKRSRVSITTIIRRLLQVPVPRPLQVVGTDMDMAIIVDYHLLHSRRTCSPLIGSFPGLCSTLSTLSITTIIGATSANHPSGGEGPIQRAATVLVGKRALLQAAYIFPSAISLLLLPMSMSTSLARDQCRATMSGA